MLEKSILWSVLFASHLMQDTIIVSGSAENIEKVAEGKAYWGAEEGEGIQMDVSKIKQLRYLAIYETRGETANEGSCIRNIYLIEFITYRVDSKDFVFWLKKGSGKPLTRPIRARERKDAIRGRVYASYDKITSGIEFVDQLS